MPIKFFTKTKETNGLSLSFEKDGEEVSYGEYTGGFFTYNGEIFFKGSQKQAGKNVRSLRPFADCVIEDSEEKLKLSDIGKLKVQPLIVK